VEKEQVVQHVITNLCMGLQADQLHGMVVSSPTVQLPELTVSLQAQSSLDSPIMSVESQALSPETSTVAQTSHNTYTIPVPPEPTSAHIQQDYVNQSVSIDDQSSRELNNNNSENNFTSGGVLTPRAPQIRVGISVHHQTQVKEKALD